MKILTRHWGVLVVLFISLLPLIDLLHPGLPLTHDGKDHVARIANFYQALSEGVIFPRWGANLNWGYGHPVLMFLYPLSSYIASAFHLIGFSLTDSVKLVFATGFVASGLTMFFWARNQWDNYVGVAAAALYMYAPYRFVDLYVRGAIGEHMAFIFPPLILYFTLEFFKSKSARTDYFYFSLVALSTALLILAHNAISIMFFPVICAYICILSYTRKRVRKLILSFGGLFIGFLLSSFFVLPAFIEGKYTLRDIVVGDEYKTRFIDPLKLFFSPWNYGITGQFSIQLGFVQLVGLIMFPFTLTRLFKSKKKENALLLMVFLVFFILSLFVMLPHSQFLYDIVTTLKKFQFPWRFLCLCVFTLALGAAMNLIPLKEKGKKIALFVGIVLLIIFSKDMFKANGYLDRPDSFYNAIYEGTTDTGESAPIWSVRFMEKKAAAPIEVIEGVAYVKKLERRTNYHTYEVNVESDVARIRENTLYFPGWFVKTASGNQQIQFQDPANRGLLTFNLDKCSHVVNVVFKETKLRKLSDTISLISALALLLGGLYVFKFKHDKK